MKTLLLFFLALKSTKALVKHNDADSPFDFQMFENFELTKNVYVREAQIVAALRQIHSDLEDTKSTIKRVLTSAGAREVQDRMNELNTNYKRSLEQMQSWTAEDFPTFKDYAGALGGLIRLQFAYKWNLTELSENGNLQFSNVENGQDLSFGTFERLVPSDLAPLAQEAANKNYLSIAIDFAKEALRMVEKEPHSYNEIQLNMLKKLVKDLAQVNNKYLTKRKTFMDDDMLIKPFLVDDRLEKKDKQPKFVEKGQFEIDKWAKNVADEHFMTVCRTGQYLKSSAKNALKCRFLHHGNPYLKLGPFKEDQKSREPYAVIFHDILSETEMDFLIAESTPNLSRKRYTNDDISEGDPYEFKQGGNKVRIVHKTVQAWLKEVEFKNDSDTKFTIEYPLLWKLSAKIKLATQLDTVRRYSATPIQVTNYGLGGLCEAHYDPHGYLEGKDLPPSRQDLVMKGDMLGTFMAWLKDVGAGGGTAYLYPGHEGILMPEKGAAAFWYDLFANGYRDHTSNHGGCPVLKGSKWILNKWMYYFDNFQKFPCQLSETARYAEPSDSHYF